MPILKNSLRALNTRFTQIPNELIDCRTLSQAAKGVYCYLASKPETWNFSMEDIQAHFPKPIKAAIKELEDSRWLIKQSEPIKGKGKGFEWVWYIALTPFTDEDVEQIATKHNFNYHSIFTTIVETIEEKERTKEKEDYSNTDGKEKEYDIDKSISKEKEIGPLESKFEEFWVGYKPIHTDKGAKKKAKEIFLAKVKKEDPDEIIRGMNKYISACHSTGSYTQNVTTFLNQEHWKDYLEEEKLIFRNPNPLIPQDYNQDMTADNVVALVWSRINTWWAANQGLANKISAITKEVRNPTTLNYHQKALQMALELAKEIFRYKDSPEVKNSLVDPLFWLSHKDVITELYVATKMSGMLYLGYQLGILAMEG